MMQTRDITLLTKVHIAKAMVFQIIVPSAEEFMLSNCDAEKILENPLDSKEIKPINPKGNQT